MRKQAPLLSLAVFLAAGLFALTFRGPRSRFWDRMTATGLILGTLSLAAQPQLRKIRFSPRDMLLGVLSAAGLYGIFHLGDRLARIIVPGGGEQIAEIYELKRIRPRVELMARLGFVIGPAEELFWRGFLQRGLMDLWGSLWGTLISALAYGGVHIASGNFTLVGAATVAGAFWGGLYGLGVPLGALIVSHVLWDNFIFLIAPTTQLSAKASSLATGETL